MFLLHGNLNGDKQKGMNVTEVGYEFACPHCQGTIVVFPADIRCTIFRHATYRNNGNPIPPHTPKEECERLVREGIVWGCGKPFRFDGTHVEICDYI